MDTKVQVWLNDKQIGEVVIAHDDDCEPTQLAASAHRALSDDASFVVNGQTITVPEIREWWA